MTDESTEDLPSRYIIGIDLGTTNSAVTAIDTLEEPWRIQVFRIPQRVAVGQIEAREGLPSFHYEPTESELAAGGWNMEWDSGQSRHVVGVLAREQAALVPGRAINSAKSWLCHAGVDRTAALLPWQSGGDVEQLSPVEVSSRYLAHIRQAWDAAYPKFPLATQDVVVTIPASFDEVARELTIQAARDAGLHRIVLIEEPQAAFYSWIDEHAQSWDQLVHPGQTILVCDVGGGTTDFTLIRVRRDESGDAMFHRVAVGEHLILGGDNLDLMLAQFAERKILAQEQLSELDHRQWTTLVRKVRAVKERFLGLEAPDELTINVPAAGSKLLAAGLQVRLERAEVQQLLIDGFLPVVEFADRPQRRQSGFQEFGLPYASDAAITRYLAAFLEQSRFAGRSADESSNSAHPDVVLFNGGLFASPLMQTRVIETLKHWFGASLGADWGPVVLDNPRVDLAVARGAAYYGMVRRGRAVRISAGLARTYYIGVDTGSGGETKHQAVCLMPAGCEAGHTVTLDQHGFNLRISEPVQFPLFVSSTRLTDSPGDLVEFEPEQMRRLPPMRTVIKSRKSNAGSVAVKLNARLTEIGTLELWCSERDGNRSWRLNFDVRTATRTDVDAYEGTGESSGILDESVTERCRDCLTAVFGSGASREPGELVSDLSSVLETDRHQWPTTVMRSLWDDLLELEPGRSASAAHESRWLNLLGFLLRPGYGVALDDWRVDETWKRIRDQVRFAVPQNRADMLVLWRRICGGLNRGQQIQLASSAQQVVRQAGSVGTAGANKSRGKKRKSRAGSVNIQELAEAWRLLGALELLPVATKRELGQAAIRQWNRTDSTALRNALAWTIGRLGTRQPLYGPLNVVVPADQAADWIRSLMKSTAADPTLTLTLVQLARKTDDRFRDIDGALRTELARWMSRHGAADRYIELIERGGTLIAEDQTAVFGDSLPIGLAL